jgi:diguanylate cyclase (GGDEF)-like protein
VTVFMRESRLRGLARRAAATLGILSWGVMLGSFTLGLFLGRNSATYQSALVAGMGCFFALVIARLLVSIYVTPERRVPLAALATAIALWAAGSAVLNASSNPDVTKFPAPGEWLFLASYVGIAGYLVLDCRRRMTTAATTWLEAAVVCGGTACLTGSVLLTPFAGGFGAEGLPLLVALLYPIIDLALAMLVVGQVALRMRADLTGSAYLVLGFVLFAIADLQFVTNLHTGTYSFSSLNDLTWGVGFALIVTAICRTPVSVKVLPRKPGPALLVLASAAAMIVLTLRPGGVLGWYLALAATVTLVAAGGRLAIALREANGAAEAFALSRTDDLTLLPNRRAVRSRLDEGIGSSSALSLMMLDLDGFKEVNDTLGHSAGDSVLQISAHRMREALPVDVMVARLGGDEFAVIVADDDEISLLETAQVVIDVIAQPLTIDGIELTTNASIGISILNDADLTSTDLLRRADVAMYQAKQNRSGALLYDVHQDDFSRQKLQLAEELRRAIPEGQLVLWYQPQVDAASQQMCGVEALVRWEHPEHGLLSPAVFLPAARRAGLMLQISQAVAQMAVNDLRMWRNRGMDIRIAVNCAPPELLSGMFLPRLFEMVRESGVPGDSLVIEVTEDSFLAEPERARSIIREIRQNQLQVAIDDYGTGFSSLSYLRDLPVQELKMDRSFISTIRSDPRSRMIVSSTFQMAQALGVRMVAEGVEDAATSADLVAMGVDVLQGYYLARPMPAADLEGWFRAWHTPATALGNLRADDAL